jgi:hypothetical protein
MKRPHRQSGFAHLILVVLIGLAIVTALGFAVVAKGKHAKGLGSGEADWKAGCTGADRVTLTHTPMDLADIATIAPMGLTAGAHVTPIDHLYFYPKAKERDAVPVYAMADGYIKDISERTQSTDTGAAKQGEFRIIMQHSCQTITYFDLVTSLDPVIAKQWHAAHLGGLSIPIKAGQVVGRIGGQTLDTAVYNMNLTLPGFIHPAMYEGEFWKIHSDDFFAYFNDPLRSQFLTMNPRKIPPYSGKIDYDQPGKLIGNWFVEGSGGYAGPKNGSQVGSNGHGYWNGHLSIHYDPYDGKSIVVSVGEFGPGGQPQAFSIVGNQPDPAKVTPETGVVKYELTQKDPGAPGAGQFHTTYSRIMGVAVFQVLPGEKLKVELFPDKTAAQVTGFTPAAKTYER